MFHSNSYLGNTPFLPHHLPTNPYHNTYSDFYIYHHQLYIS